MEDNRGSIRDEGGLDAFGDFVGIAENDIWDMASGFAKRTAAKVCVNFGMPRVKYTLGIMYWAQGESRCSRTASLRRIIKSNEYKALLGTALDRVALRKAEADQSDTISKAADPGQFKDELLRTTYPQSLGSTACICHMSYNFRQLLTALPISKATLLQRQFPVSH